MNDAREKYFWDIRVSEKFEGDESGNIHFGGKRFAIMGADYFMSEIVESLSELYSGAAGGIIRQTGREYGKELLEVIDEQEQDKRFGSFLGFLEFIGYSEIEVGDEKLTVTSSPTAEEHLKTDHDGKKICFFLEGILTGAYQDIYSTEKTFQEVKCKADGADKCVFSREDEETE